MKPTPYVVSWWNRSNRTAAADSEVISKRQFVDQSEASRFLDGLDSTRYWTKIEPLIESQ